MEDEDETEETEAVLKEFWILFEKCRASLCSHHSMMKIELQGFICMFLLHNFNHFLDYQKRFIAILTIHLN